MRLQSAIFYLEDTLLTDDPAHARADADKVLAILKMESVWMYAVTGLPRAEAERAIEAAGLGETLRGVLTQREYGRGTAMLEWAMKRLQSNKRDTVVFCGRLDALKAAAEAGFRTVAVRGRADEEEWRGMCTLAEEHIESFRELLG